MAHRETAPYAAQNHKEVRELIHNLEAHKGKKGKGGFSVKKSTFPLPNGRSVDSWKMNDWDYKKEHLPTYARGLFTYQTVEGNYEIAVRGYDKFFNHGEVRKTEWRNVQNSTRGPYELSVKENGCIIFISGLDDDTLLVCSKHSTGARGDVALSHACAGERWVERHIATVGKTKQELARRLRMMNATLVAELCDDEFEEHVLAYTPEQAGLYVHGLNLNLPQFATYPGPLVDQFADEWGMKKVQYVMIDDIDEVKSFLETVAETGNYNGRDTEGFVIRCQSRVTDDAPWEDWFFKYKFEEPYLMYRQWRECTKAMISGKPPRYKKHKEVTEEYLEYARRRFAREPNLAKQYNLNHGIIKLRDDFLRERGTTGAEIIRQEMLNGGQEDKDVDRNVVLVPIATIGCGKTTLALALVKLFGWGHFQNDNVAVKKNRPQFFAESITSLLVTNPVVIADRNNHQKRERDQLLGDISRVNNNTHFVALHYVHERDNYDNIRRATRARVLNRGDNHQTIQAGSKGQSEIIEIMEGFMHRFQPIDPSEPPDDQFDLVIHLDPVAESRENLELIISQLSEKYPALFKDRPMPTDTDMDDAIHWALNDYTPDFKMDLSRSGNKNQKHNQPKQGQSQTQPKPPKQPRMEYFAVRLPTPRITALLAAAFRDVDPQTALLYNHLSTSRRIQPEFHVTLMHRASAALDKPYWDKLLALHTAAAQAPSAAGADASSTRGSWDPELGTCQVRIERLVWDARIMCFVVRLDGGVKAPDGGGEELRFETVNAVAHVTVGTRDQSVKPKESNDLLQRWLNEGSGGETGIWEVPVKGSVVVEGSVRGVLAKL